MHGTPTPAIAELDDASQARERLRALRLEQLPNRRGGKARPLAALAVLDIGCGGGFLCGEALHQGARHVVGIDTEERSIERARARFPGVEFAHRTRWDIPGESFDVIFLLSGVEDEPDLGALLKHLASHLCAGGTLVLECGISSLPGRRWQEVADAGAARRYPTQPLFLDRIAAAYATRLIGAAARQGDDGITRLVFHCRVKHGTVLLVSGPSGAGKSMLAREFQRLQIPTLRTDAVLAALLHQRRFDGMPLAATVRQCAGEPPVHFGRIGDIIAVQRPGEFAKILLDEMPKHPDLVCIEGEILRQRSVRDPLVAGIRGRGLRPWYVAPARTTVVGATVGRVAGALRTAAVCAVLATARAWRWFRFGPRLERPRASAADDAARR